MTDNQCINDSQSTCPMCAELNSGKMPNELIDKSGLRDRILVENDEFVIIPSVSPLKMGHIMIVPRKHITSIVQLSVASVLKFEEFKKEIVLRITRKLGPVFCWEHGVGKNKNGGCGITHAHFHILPLIDEHATQIDSTLSQMFPHVMVADSMKVFHDRSDSSCSYLYWEINSMSPRIVTSEGIKSQLMRELICKVENLDNWNWKEYNNWQDFRETVQSLQFIYQTLP